MKVLIDVNLATDTITAAFEAIKTFAALSTTILTLSVGRSLPCQASKDLTYINYFLHVL